ncbi:MAG: hypothetical protein MZU79_01045 [Anaerotruncus sp.]|nr:hypothetical protein [Anaerotruncus sp.]
MISNCSIANFAQNGLQQLRHPSRRGQHPVDHLREPAVSGGGGRLLVGHVRRHAIWDQHTLSQRPRFRDREQRHRLQQCERHRDLYDELGCRAEIHRHQTFRCDVSHPGKHDIRIFLHIDSIVVRHRCGKRRCGHRFNRRQHDRECFIRGRTQIPRGRSILRDQCVERQRRLDREQCYRRTHCRQRILRRRRHPGNRPRGHCGQLHRPE